MKKKINIFDYLDYVLFLNEDFLSRSTQNPSYSLRAYARDLKLSVSYLSKILNRKQQISLSTGEKIFSCLGYNEEEMIYASKLLTYNTSKSTYERQKAFEYLKKHHPFSELKPDASKDLVINSIHHFLVFSLIKMFSSPNNLIKAGEKIGISKKKFNLVINELLENNYIKKEKNKYFVLNDSFIIREHKKLHIFHKEFSMFVLEKIMEKNDLSRDDCSGHGLTLSVDEELLPEFFKTLEHNIRTLYKIAEKSSSKKTDFLFYFSDSAVAIDIRK